jgi:hypothetical protein
MSTGEQIEWQQVEHAAWRGSGYGMILLVRGDEDGSRYYVHAAVAPGPAYRTRGVFDSLDAAKAGAHDFAVRLLELQHEATRDPAAIKKIRELWDHEWNDANISSPGS